MGKGGLRLRGMMLVRMADKSGFRDGRIASKERVRRKRRSAAPSPDMS